VRNYLRDDVQVGDDVLFYASNADPSGVTGLATIARAGYPDPFATKKGHRYYDPKSTADNPIWFTVDVAFVERFPAVVPLDVLKRTKGLEKMLVNQKGSRLSVQPCTRREFDIVCRLGRRRS
jgi:predicted RNA-binding protein with PUA-like domain